ncbi:hypothetical protein P5673_006243 [Acropora cervicornis]|uniref:Uncharacterized protein n=1 Tax=Acropora cervicornis TaxID=6130 RepID=A0AAD9QXP3_ACRCE|nr:hypothetical protein P5673_006243 [Acropora cervicornis]
MQLSVLMASNAVLRSMEAVQMLKTGAVA